MPDRQEQVITLIATATGFANIQACPPGTTIPDPNVEAIQINVLPQIALPPAETDAGYVARLLIAETLSPERKSLYGDGSDAFKSMELMRSVLDNRLSAANQSPSLKKYVACSPTSMSWRGIINANQCSNSASLKTEQFAGFSSNGIEEPQAALITKILENANNGNHPSFLVFRRHVEKAIAVAQSPIVSRPVSATTLYYWRTEAKGSPSATTTTLHFSIGKQTFFTLNQSYINELAETDKKIASKKK